MKRYTLHEAGKIRRMDYCAQFDHSWQVISSLANGPMRITCDECGWSGSVSMGDRPKRPEGSE